MYSCQYYIEITYKIVPKTLHRGWYPLQLTIIFRFYRNGHLHMTSLRVMIYIRVGLHLELFDNLFKPDFYNQKGSTLITP